MQKRPFYISNPQYLQLVEALLGRKLKPGTLDESDNVEAGDFAPLPLITLDNCGEPLRRLPGDLSPATDTAVFAEVGRLLGAGLVAQWETLGEDERVGLLQAAVKANGGETRTDINSDAQDVEPMKDGPVAPDGFQYKGVLYKGLTAKPFAAIRFIWSTRNRCAVDRELGEPVWGDHVEEPDKNAVGNLRKQLNTFFRKNDIPFHAATSYVHPNYLLSLRNGPPKPSPKKAASRR